MINNKKKYNFNQFKVLNNLKNQNILKFFKK